ncbi:MAG: glutamate--tRNA ligase [Rickettsiales bacterium]|nr:glutamate--tRNA ligase [Pseudomonadota bacterium]MDA0966197.1 glutamate--tRNA ligase [Pseudomonadota bacterium]MDG4543138.1 glutamate--tRNA ligase [Rickettsiales bacterium]MDG4545336.1 glutamate--tRNA ligase [Rickettsiales bacterium]MDG4547785.1 glutamate--tRNA ligase [Rickettsiales bacterium]
MTVVTRFAPSPTGFLHIGGARTALFNWLYAKNKGGKFLLRIEDTDRKRSTDEAVNAILDGMKWLGLNWDDEFYQFSRVERHKEVALELVSKKKAYKCYCTKEELDAKREQAMAEKRSPKYDGTCRHRADIPNDIEPAIRLKAPQEGETAIEDVVQGRVVVQNSEQDDMIILRSDGTPTYMLAVVVDDHDMEVTHVIRGDDHLTNATRQQLIYDALDWKSPVYAHIPLIHGADGAKMSKRHGALGVEAYRDMGYLPEAICNYLLRLGWSHGDDEIISTEQAINWFNLESLGKSPSRFDFVKLDNLNSHYISKADDERLVGLITPLLEKRIGKPIDDLSKKWLTKGMTSLKQRVKNLNELTDLSLFYAFGVPSEFTPQAQKALSGDATQVLRDLLISFEELESWEAVSIESFIRKFAEDKQLGLGKIMMPLRAAITGSHVSPDMFEVVEILGKSEVNKRVAAVV